MNRTIANTGIANNARKLQLSHPGHFRALSLAPSGLSKPRHESSQGGFDKSLGKHDAKKGDTVLTELQGSLIFAGPPVGHRQSGGPGEI